MSQGGLGGMAHLPDPGGLNDQCAWTMDAFSILNNAQAEWDEWKKSGTWKVTAE